MRANTPMNSERLISRTPLAVNQKLTELSVGNGDVPDTQLLRDHEVHDSHDKGHRDEEDHDRPVRREHLVIVIRRQIARRIISQSLLRSHHDRVGKAAQQHHKCQDAVHDADTLMVDARDPFAPQIRDPPLEPHESDDAEDGQHHDDGDGEGNGLVEAESPPRSACQALSFLRR